jgi:hypothetical protein
MVAEVILFIILAYLVCGLVLGVPFVLRGVGGLRSASGC